MYSMWIALPKSLVREKSVVSITDQMEYIARSCQEQFKFHLGKNLQPHDFMLQWDSQTKFEQSYIGHLFAFRLATNPSILVDMVTFQPTCIIDCPTLKEKVQVNKVTSVGELQGLFFPFTNDGEASNHGRLLDNLHLGEHVMASQEESPKMNHSGWRHKHTYILIFPLL